MSLVFGNDGASLLMVEVWIKSLLVRFRKADDCGLRGKKVIKMRVMDNTLFDVTPNSSDYDIFYGDAFEKTDFHGGFSCVFGIPFEMVEKPILTKDPTIMFTVRLEYGSEKYKKEEREIGYLMISLQPAFLHFSKELQIRRKLGNLLEPPHNSPISHNEWWPTRKLRQFKTNKYLDNTLMTFFLRVSYLGNCVITEIDRWIPKKMKTFYAQEQSNLTKPYECKQLSKKWPHEPTTKLSMFSYGLGCRLACACSTNKSMPRKLPLSDGQGECVETDAEFMEQKNRKFEEQQNCKIEEQRNRKFEEQPDRKLEEKQTHSELRFKESTTVIGPMFQKQRIKKARKLIDEDLLKKIIKQRHGSGPVVYIPKDKPCLPVCESCVPSCIPCYNPFYTRSYYRQTHFF